MLSEKEKSGTGPKRLARPWRWRLFQLRRVLDQRAFLGVI